MADQPISYQETIDMRKDALTLKDAVNGNESGIVTPRLNDPYSTLPAAIQKIESDGAAAVAKLENTGGLISAPTLTALQAITPEYDYQLARVDDTGNEYRWNPALLTTVKWEATGRNFLNDAKIYTDNLELSIIRALHGRFGVTKNLLTTFSASSNSSVVLAILRWSGAAIATNGIFGAVRLSVTGANYPNVANDSTVFNSPLRLQGFAGSTLVFSRDLTRLSNSDVWYHRDKTLSRTDITEIKIVAYPASGVTISFENAVIQSDGGFGNPEIDARNLSIEESKKQINESIIYSLFTADTSNLASVKEVKNATSIQQVFSGVLTENLKKLSAGCLIECDGTYPEVATAGGSFALRVEIVNPSNAVIGSFFLKRIANTKIWYRQDIDISAFETINGRLKLTIPVPSGSTYVTAKSIVFGDMGLPQPLFDLLKSSVTKDVVETATEVAQQTAESAISAGNLGWPSTAFDAISRASSRRVDVVAFGDSNQFMDGYGFDYALRNALSNRFGLYATAPLSGENSAQFPVATSGASTEQSKHVLASLNYLYVAEGTVISSATLNGIIVGGSTGNVKAKIDTASKLRCHFAYSTFATGAGSFKPGVRIEQSPWSVKKMAELINTNTGSESKVLAYFDLDADAARSGLPLGFKWTVPQQTAITGPFLSYFMRVEDLNKENGVCFSTIYGGSGQSLWDMVSRMLEYSIQHLTNYFSEIRRLQLSKNQEPIVVIYINSGLNDQNETSSPSWGWRESTDGKSATAYLDNLEALTKRISDVWQINGWNEKELFFWINPSHPISTPDSVKLKAYRKAAYTFAGSRSRVSVVDFENLTNEAELTANNWYRTPDDHNHLKLAGYEALSQRIVDLI
ncbi:hypothetical protein LRQ09_13840 [Acinetobacter soli]|uniref:hypothetical protein n=1 Tax=Acinetobacter soli TaxID=487316 RepID=UPI001F439182|nr:hypothetical protein [Acinetobacter soli]MCF3128444.1 hypothetical protein [Acinetobacter soli]